MEDMQHTHRMQDSKHSMYGRFVLMAVAMFIAMYCLMFAMIDSVKNFIPNINNVYMTSLMVSVMMLIELWIMKKMYTHSGFNWIIIIIAVTIGALSWLGIREQVSVGDEQFVKGMIPHHAAALLMSEKANLTDPELIKLQKNILETQSQEIELMKRKLKELEKNR